MIKNYTQYINEDIRSKTIYTEVKCDNLTSLYPDICVYYYDSKIVIGGSKKLSLNKEFYDALEKDDIKVDDIIFEDCAKIRLVMMSEFTKVSDYGKFGENIKEFDCSYCYNLTSLEFTPEKVGGDFNCSNCENLTSLEFAPKTVDGYFRCCDCNSLTSLEGAPKTIGGGFFNCSGCLNLTSLQGAPKEVGGDFNCNECKKLTSLDGAPKIVGYSFYCIGCNNLTSLDGSPDVIHDYFYCTNCNPNFIKLAKQKYGSKGIS